VVVRSADDLACDGIFETDEELEEFLAYTYAARRADLVGADNPVTTADLVFPVVRGTVKLDFTRPLRERCRGVAITGCTASELDTWLATCDLAGWAG